MTEPISPRAAYLLAVEHLGTAAGSPSDSDGATTDALVGIGYALLALQTQPDTDVQPEPDTDAQPGRQLVAATVTRWNVEDGGILGATIVCGDCRGAGCETCSRDGELFIAYELPGGRRIDLHRDADLYAQIQPRRTEDEAPRDA